MAKKPNRFVTFAKNKLYSFYISFLMPLSYAGSRELNHSYSSTINLIDHPKTDRIDQSLHVQSAAKAIGSYRLQKSENIPDIFQPGKMWTKILENVATYRAWNASHDDAIMDDALFRFYRSDMIFGHSGDAYIWEIKNGTLDLKKQVFMIIRRYKEFIRKSHSFDSGQVSTTDIGQNIYVGYLGKKITFKIIRFACYLDRILTLKLLPVSNPIIGELGTGAGELTILTKRIIPSCRYICFDLPETLMVSSYNVMMTFPDKKIGLYEDFRNSGKITRQDIEKYDIILLPNWCIGWVEEDAIDLFINIGSMCEMDLPIIENYIRNIEKICKGYFYTINRNVKGIVEFGVEDVALEEFPFSEKSHLISAKYDIASDIYHQRYGMDYQCNYWEYIYKLR